MSLLEKINILKLTGNFLAFSGACVTLSSIINLDVSGIISASITFFLGMGLIAFGSFFLSIEEAS